MKTPRLTKDGKLPHITMPLKYGEMACDIQDLLTGRLSNHTLAEVCRYIAGYFYRQQKANENRIEALEAARDGAYTERNRLVALLATLFPSGTKKTAILGWDEAWHGCVYIDLPVGQASWHYHDSEAHLFAHLPPYEGEWDGHTTEEKYERISLAANHIKQTDELLADYMKFADALMIQTDNQNKRIKQLETALRNISVIAPLAQSSDIARAALAGEKKDGETV